VARIARLPKVFIDRLWEIAQGLFVSVKAHIRLADHYHGITANQKDFDILNIRLLTPSFKGDTS
jgi:hypothetical protein